MTSWPADAPSPLWRRLSREVFAAESLDGEIDTDIAVVGGGISGLATALELAGRGLGCVVLEAATVGAGASGRSNGQVIPTLTRPDPPAVIRAWGEDHGDAFLRMLAGSADLLFDTAERLEIDCDACRSGWLQPAHSPGRARLAERRVAQWRDLGAPVEALDPAQMADYLGTSAYHGGLLHRAGGHINSLAFTRGLARGSVAAGVRIFERSPVVSLERRGEGWLLATPAGRVRAARVALTTAAHSGSLWAGLAQSIVPVSSYQAATRPLGTAGESILPGNQACSDSRADLRFFRKDREGRLVSGGALALELAAGPRLGRLVSRRLGTLFPQLGAVPIEQVWSGRIAMTPERLPHLHRSADGLTAWVGCNGRGLALSMAMGKVVADAVTGASADALPLPLTAPKGLPFHWLVKRTARLILPYYRLRDRREM